MRWRGAFKFSTLKLPGNKPLFSIYTFFCFGATGLFTVEFGLKTEAKLSLFIDLMGERALLLVVLRFGYDLFLMTGLLIVTDLVFLLFGLILIFVILTGD